MTESFMNQIGLFFPVSRAIKCELKDVSCHHPIDK